MLENLRYDKSGKLANDNQFSPPLLTQLEQKCVQKAQNLSLRN